MTATVQMVAWLRAAMDAAQADAESATPGPWATEGDDLTDDIVFTAHDGEHGDLVGETVAHVRGGKTTAANMRHIARHDPDAVLRRIAADRKILEVHRNDGGDCVVCADPLESSDDSEGNREWSRAAQYYPCQTVRLLAEGYGWTEETTA